MKYNDLNGEEHTVNLSRKRNKDRKKSKLHSKAVDTILSISPLTTLCEELPIRIKRGHTLYIDIFLPDFGVVIEVQGPQHFKFMKNFHKHVHRFGRAKLNDDLKREWCNVNDFQLIELKYNEVDTWHDRLHRAIG